MNPTVVMMYWSQIPLFQNSFGIDISDSSLNSYREKVVIGKKDLLLGTKDPHKGTEFSEIIETHFSHQREFHATQNK